MTSASNVGDVKSGAESAVSTESQYLGPHPKTPDSLKRPWEYRSAFAPTERLKSHEKFRYYLTLSAPRTFKAVAIHFGVSLPTISAIAKGNAWITRAAAYDEMKAIVEAENERERRHEEHMQKLSEFRDRSETVGTAMITSAARLLQAANKTLSRMQAADEELDRKLLASVLQASARVAESGRILMSQSLGVDALMAGLDGAEGDGDEYS